MQISYPIKNFYPEDIKKLKSSSEKSKIKGTFSHKITNMFVCTKYQEIQFNKVVFIRLFPKTFLWTLFLI